MLLLAMLLPGAVLADDDQLPDHDDWYVNDGETSAVDGVFEQYAKDAVSGDSYEDGKAVDTDPVPVRGSGQSVYRRIVNTQPHLQKWVDPWVDAGDGAKKNYAVKLNTAKPTDTAFRARPFHSIKKLSPHLQDIEISKKLMGGDEDIKACYRINKSTSAEVVQQGGKPAIRLNYSSSF